MTAPDDGQVMPKKLLDDDVRDRLVARRGEWRQIAADANVSYSWVSQFVRRVIVNPGYHTLRSLRAALIKRRTK